MWTSSTGGINVRLKLGFFLRRVWLQGYPVGVKYEMSGVLQRNESFGTTQFPKELFHVKSVDQAQALKGASGRAILNHEGDLVGVMIGVVESDSSTRFWIVRETTSIVLPRL